LVAQLIKDHFIVSAHDISEGGLIVTLLESAYYNNKGFEVSSNNSQLRKDAYWMGEAQSRVVVSCKEATLASIEEAHKAGIAATVIGKVTGGVVKVEGEDWGNISAWKTSTIQQLKIN
jgi:phosphoribosylformylglycinamidine synthase